MWVKSQIKTDYVNYASRRPIKKHSKCSRSSKRYYILKSKRRPSRIATKKSSSTIGSIHTLHAASEGDKTWDSEHSETFDTDSFIIGIDNHASCTMMPTRITSSISLHIIMEKSKELVEVSYLYEDQEL
jgi:hypothetical protein